ncbi:t-SNARE [Eremomyces bilateralis CBS 781.70]|uniref:t-SNARE n=1 Tax=Eremomyces bilateralis CBS 781.70 TaxID=1392243 RepID=A0A6G1FXE5_9PEZI|nr:t-SNARE [Eremomyces bilateralis CBS 781.70]KAF1810382.1 t-SNARE [Eremomyces bilateralis CBS 781.70]
MPRYGGYNQGGYGQIDSFDQQNPYDQRPNEGNSGYGYVEMGSFNRPPQASFGAPQGGMGGNSLLNDVQDIDRTIESLEEDLQELNRLHQRRLNDTNTDLRQGGQSVDIKAQDIMTAYRGLVDRMKRIKSNPESGSTRNAPQVGRADRRLKAMINKYQTQERDMRKELQQQTARQYKIVRPEATEEEIQAVVEEPSGPIFSQALMQSDRRGQAQRTLGAVQQRHAEIQKIERQMIELAQLFQDLDAVVMQQDEMVVQIEQKGEEVHENIVKGNTELDTGIIKARGARRKKWWCLLICSASP